VIINEREYKMLEDAQGITCSDYLRNAKKLVDDDGYCYYIEPSSLICAVDDLMYELERQKEEYEDRIDYIRCEENPNYNYYEEQKLREEN